MFEDKNIIRIEEKQFNSNRPMFKGNSQWALVVSQFVDQAVVWPALLYF